MAYPPDDELTVAQIRERFGWSIRQFREARDLGFPRAGWRQIGGHYVEPVWPRQSVEKWTARVRALRLDRRR